jgi:nucleoside 2-deoxyribosyltransferase
MNKTIYLSGPMQSRSSEEMNEWRIETKKKLSAFNCLDPTRREYDEKDMLGVNEIVQMDRKDVENSDIVLVNYNCARQKTTLCGTSMEVFYAHSLGKFIIAFTDLPVEEWSPWMIYHCTRILPSFDDAIDYIRKHF